MLEQIETAPRRGQHVGPTVSAGAWFGLLVIGQFATLELIKAGPVVAYQHLATWRELLSGRYLPFLAVVLIQGLAVLWGLRPHLRGMAAFARTFASWQLWLIAAVFVLSSATLSRSPTNYGIELLLATFLQLVALGNVVVMVLRLRPNAAEYLSNQLRRLAAAPDRSKPHVDRYALCAALFVIVAAALLSYFAYERHPHIPDEVIYLFHARYFAEGKLYLPAPPVPAAFDVDLLYSEANRWFSPVPPGWPALLSLGVLLGAAWLVNPILAGLNVLLAYRFTWELFDRPTARASIALLAVSPWHVFMSMNFMTHTSTMLCALVAANAVAMLRRTGRLRWALVGGLGIGLVSLNRPLEGLAVAGLLGLWALGVRGRVFRFAPVLVLAGGSMLVGALTMPYNKLLTGSVSKFPIMMYTDRYYGAGSNALGFGANRGLGWPGLDPLPGHGAADVLINANLNTFAVNVELFGWATGSLLLLAFLLCSGRMRRHDYYLLASIVMVVGLHSFYWFSGGPDFGARYWYLILLPCIILTVRGAQALRERLEHTHPADHLSARVAIGVAALSLSALLTFFPWRAIDKYHHYRGMRPDVRELIDAYDFGRSIVLVRGKRHPDYASAVPYNPLDLNADGPVFAWDRGPAVRLQLAKVYADRPVWLVDGPTITGDGYRVVGGPIPFTKLDLQPY